MQARGGPGEDDSGGFAYGGWSVRYWDATGKLGAARIAEARTRAGSEGNVG